MCAWRCTFTTSIYEGGPRPGSCGMWWPLQTMGVSPPLLTVAFFCRSALSILSGGWGSGGALCQTLGLFVLCFFFYRATALLGAEEAT